MAHNTPMINQHEWPSREITGGQSGTRDLAELKAQQVLTKNREDFTEKEKQYEIAEKNLRVRIARQNEERLRLEKEKRDSDDKNEYLINIIQGFHKMLDTKPVKITDANIHLVVWGWQDRYCKLGEERDFYKKEAGKQAQMVQSSQHEAQKMSHQNDQLINERDNLHHRANKLQQHVHTMQHEMDQLKQSISKLQQENFELQDDSSNMAGSFPTLEEVLNNFQYLNEQQLVEFILRFDGIPAAEELPKFLASLTTGLTALVLTEYNHFLTQVYPSSLQHLRSQPSRLNQELTIHLQKHYRSIVDMDPKLQACGVSVPEVWAGVKGFGKEVGTMLRAFHGAIWQIQLTPQLKFTELWEFDRAAHKCPLQGSKPVVVFPPLVYADTTNIAAFGYAY